MLKSLIRAAACTFALGGTALAHDNTLIIYTYDSFITEWGPGPQIEAAFEASCECNLEFVSAGDGAALLSRLRLEGTRSPADIVLGLDTTLTAEAAKTGLFKAHDMTPDTLNLPVAWDDPNFLPYDWGYFAFVYDKTRLATPPESFQALLDAPEELKIVIQDPRSSTPGLGLLMWVKDVFGDDAGDVWTKLSPRIVTVTKGWSEAYGMFLEGEADMVLSYTTSPAYHLIAEQDDTKAAAIFSEGHYMQIEVAGILSSTDEPALADKFMEFMISEEFQAVIPTTNWMFPAVLPKAGLPEGFGGAVPEGKALIIDAAEVPALKRLALDEWLAALSK